MTSEPEHTRLSPHSPRSRSPAEPGPSHAEGEAVAAPAPAAPSTPAPSSPPPPVPAPAEVPEDPLAPPTPAEDPHNDVLRENLLAALYADEPDFNDPLEDPGEPEEPDTPAAPPPPARPRDPWAHRRGEPRLFAFLWSLYVLAAVAGSLVWLARIPVASATAYSPAARTLLIVIAAGITVLWPMTRLCQAVPERAPLTAVLADLFVILAPVQMVVWPMIILANWPVAVVGGVAALLAAWATLIAGVLAVAFTTRPRRRKADAKVQDDRPLPAGPGPLARSLYMSLCLALTLAAPAVLVFQPLRGATSLAWLHGCSPFTAIFLFTGSGWSGPTDAPRQFQWAAILLALAVAAALWALAAARRGAGPPPRSRIH